MTGGVTSSYVYDGNGNRVIETAGGTTTVYVSSYFEWTGSTATMKSYYYAGGTRIAMRTGSSTLNYLLGDHLGSQALTLTSTGARLATNTELRYMPYGAPRYTAGTTPTSFNFTGQRKDSGSGLLFYNARWYDPVVGRFLQADTIVPSPGNPQSLNRYAYGLNNPLRYTDPTGHDVACPGQDASQCYGGLFEYWASIYDQSRLDAEIRQWLIDNQDMATIIAVGAILEELYGETNAVVPQAYAAMFANSFAGGDLPGLRNDKYAPLLAGAIMAGTGLAGVNLGGLKREMAGPAGTSVFQGIRVVRQMPIDWQMKDAKGRTNLERAQAGLAPLGPDGAPINLHHVGQSPLGPIAEVSQTTHQRFSAILHRASGPSQVDRDAFSGWRQSYWQWRASEALNARPGE